MKIGINARILGGAALRGWSRYTINLLSEMCRLHVRLVLYSDRPLDQSNLARLGHADYEVRIAPPMRYLLWEQMWLPHQCEQDKVDLLHTPINFGLPLRSFCPRVMTLHDAIDYSYYGRRSSPRRRITSTALRSGLSTWIARKAADRFITVSEHARRDLIRYLYVPPSKITVIYEAADPSFHDKVTESDGAAVSTKYSLTKPYVLYVGGWEERKNIPFLLRAFAAAKLANVDLTLVGGYEDQMFNPPQPGGLVGYPGAGPFAGRCER